MIFRKAVHARSLGTSGSDCFVLCFEINFFLFSCSNRRCVCVSILAALSLLVAGPKSKNLWSFASMRTAVAKAVRLSSAARLCRLILSEQNMLGQHLSTFSFFRGA